MLQWLVGLVLLIACTNVAGLLLARATARQREIAIRGALGACRAQVVRQLLVESSILALAGGVAGLFLSVWLTRGLVRFLPYNQEVLSLSTTPDARILLFTTGITLITAFAFGLLPAFRGSNIPASAVLKDGAGSVTGNREHVRMRTAFVALQVSTSLVLLIGAGLFVRTLDNLRKVDLGFTTDNVVMLDVNPATRYESDRKLQLYRTLMESLATVPGVSAVGANTSPLLTGGRWDSQITVTGTAPADGRVPVSFFNAVTPGYFQALGIPVTMGRDFSWSDWGSSRKLGLVNHTLATRLFSGTQAVGQQLGQGRDVPMDVKIGIRVALGEKRSGVVRLVVREMLVMILIGLVAGAAAAYLAGSYVESQLFGVKAADWSVFAVGVVTLLTAALIAAFAPALRASKIHPTHALRHE